MKELVKPQKLEKEYIDAQAYCEGGNSDDGNCMSAVSCLERVGTRNCTGFSNDEFEDEVLF